MCWSSWGWRRRYKWVFFTPLRFCHDSLHVPGLYICPSCHEKTGLHTVSKYLRIANATFGSVSFLQIFLAFCDPLMYLAKYHVVAVVRFPKSLFFLRRSLCVRSSHMAGVVRVSQASKPIRVHSRVHRQWLLCRSCDSCVPSFEAHLLPYVNGWMWSLLVWQSTYGACYPIALY